MATKEWKPIASSADVAWAKEIQLQLTQEDRVEAEYAASQHGELRRIVENGRVNPPPLNQGPSVPKNTETDTHRDQRSLVKQDNSDLISFTTGSSPWPQARRRALKGNVREGT